MSYLQKIRINELGGLAIIIVSSLLLLIGNMSLPEPEYDPLGPAGMPQYIAWMMLILSFFSLARMLFFAKDSSSKKLKETVEKSRYVELLITVVAIFGYLLALTFGGLSFPIVTFVFLSVTGIAMMHFSKTKIPLIFLISAVVSYGLTFVFRELLNVILPG